MTQEHATEDNPEPTLDEEVVASAAEAAEIAAAAPLNREQRRAQARGKKTGSTTQNPAVPHQNTLRGPGNHGGGGAGRSRLPRTGHK